MIKKLTVFTIIITLVLTLCACNNKKQENNNTEYEKTDLTVQIPEKNEPVTPVETELSSFSTVIKSRGSGRLNNIRITCSKINEQIIENGAEFSFEKIVGKSGPEDGYQQADIFVDKKIVKAYGGGNCQVSTTLYNAVLAIPELTVTERHPHGRKVDYVPEGKDAAVSYGTLDLKFKNQTGSKIKLLASSDDYNLTVKIMKVE